MLKAKRRLPAASKTVFRCSLRPQKTKRIDEIEYLTSNIRLRLEAG
jgi:hypothetical protein